MISLNNKIICEPYTGGRGIKSKITSGVSIIQQKTGIIGLKVLQDAKINDTLTITKGSTIYIKEEILYTYADLYSKVLDCKDIKEPFVLAEFSHLVFVDLK